PITFLPNLSVSGRITVDGQQSPKLPAGIRILLRTRATGTFPFVFSASSPLPDPDGTFSLSSVAAREYQVSYNRLHMDFYVKEVRAGGIDVTGQIFSVSASDPLTIVLNPSAGFVSGVARDIRQEAISDARIALVPDRNRTRFDLYKTATTDANGRFS